MNIIKLLFFYLLMGCLLLTHTALHAQCNFNVNALMDKESDCQSNGTIKASINGDLANLDMQNALFGLTAVGGQGNNQALSKNGGVITNVPPGRYKVEVKVYCQLTNQWVAGTSAEVTMIGSYKGFNQNDVQIKTGQITASLKCSPTGAVPIDIQTGRPPYTVTITASAPDASLVGTSFTSNTKGVILADQLPAGTYSFKISDPCFSYTPSTQAVVPETPPIYSIGLIQDAPKCDPVGSVEIKFKDGTAPYKINMEAPRPSTYTGPVEFGPFSNDGSYLVGNLPPGDYRFKVSDACLPQTLTVKIKEKELTAPYTQKPTFSCEKSGSITFLLSGGSPPYTITMTTAPACFPLPAPTIIEVAGSYTIDGLCEGTYQLKIKDDCGKTLPLTPSINIVKSEMSMVLESQVDAQNCGSKGSAVLTVKGGKPPYLLTGMPGGSITAPNPGNLSVINLDPGLYTAEVLDDCGDRARVVFTIKSGAITIDQEVRRTLDCRATGQVKFSMVGKPPYNTTMTECPLGYNCTQRTLTGKNPVFDNLPAGKYKFSVTDNCPTTKTIEIEIKTLQIKDLPDPYQEHFYSPSPLDPDCKQVVIKKRPDAGYPASGDMYLDIFYYWTGNAELYYEVRWSADKVNWGAWSPVEDDTTIPLPADYCQARKDGNKQYAEIRIKDTDPAFCEIIEDVISLGKVESVVSSPKNQGCNGFDLSFQQYTNSPLGLICYNYAWELLDSDQRVVQKGSSSGADEITLPQLAHGSYTLRFKDRCGDEWEYPVVSSWTNPSQFTISKKNRTCIGYDISFVNDKVCLPYSWVLIDMTTNIEKTRGDNINDLAAQEIPLLEYNKTYELNVLATKAGSKETHSISDVLGATTYAYHIDSEGKYCLPDTAKGSIRLYREDNKPFEKGSTITYVAGPMEPTGAKHVFDADNQLEYFPFASGNAARENLDLPAGLYQFIVSDACQRDYQLNIYYSASTLKNFGYTIDPHCDGGKLTPRGQLQFNGINVSTYFHIIPPGITPITQTVTEGGSFILKESGHYKLRVSNNNDPNSTCFFDTIGIEYVKQSFGLNTEASKAYMCSPNTGFIRILAKGGVGPFRYWLRVGNQIFDNFTGEFHITGSYGSEYNFDIDDQGCGVSFHETITMLNLSSEPLVYGTEKICLDGTIELNSVELGPGTTYDWKGPNEFSSTMPTPRIPAATPAMSGRYTLHVMPFGCTDIVERYIDVEVLNPKVPNAPSPEIFCLGDPKRTLEATPWEEGYHVQWYDENKERMDPPQPATNVPGTFYYHVSQVYTVLGCEGEKKRVEVIVSPLPDPAQAAAADICPNAIPVFQIANSIANYRYSIFNNINDVTPMVESTSEASGSTLYLTGTDRLHDTTTFYVGVKNQYDCTSPTRTPITVNVVDYLYIQPASLPKYKRNTAYNEQLITNAASPYAFSTDQHLPFGLSINSLGLISGTAPRNGKIDPVPFTVRVEGNDGCVKTKDYVLESELFVPQAFTPNGDGKNDLFMEGRRLVVFDRLGIKLFEGENGWDGTHNGEPAPTDTYFYCIFYDEVENGGGSKVEKTGYITLLRRK